MSIFKIFSPFNPAGDQIQAIDKLSKNRDSISSLVGVTGSGKTFTLAQVIAKQNKPILILSPNKTLAAQLYEEFSLFFPENKVCYFVSYYDYYMPESYLPSQDIYIPKEVKINPELERLRIDATASIINRKDAIIISSVSCIYSLGDPYDFKNLAFSIKVGDNISRQELLKKLVDIQYIRNDTEKISGTFSVNGNIIELILPYQKDKLKIEIFQNRIESLSWIDKFNNNLLFDLSDTLIFPAKHFVTNEEKKMQAIKSIENELNITLNNMTNPIYKERLITRVNHDIEMIKERGHCIGIENYSAHFENRKSGEKPFCLLDFFPNDFLLIIDESHVAIPQLKGMYFGDRSRKQTLIDFGFRLPSALDNRPLKFNEIEKYFKDVIFVSATPGDYELEKSSLIVEQIIRPTGLVDPLIEIHKREDQINDLIKEINQVKEKGFRSLVTVLTKKMAEELSYFLQEKGISVCYLHSNIKTPERTAIINKLREGIFDCIVGVNLLREGLDIPEVSLVAIMDADIESFLRDKRSLIQTIGRAARNTNSKVIFYCDKITKSMQDAIDETNRKRELQLEYNQKNNIIPISVKRDVKKSIINLEKESSKKRANKAQKVLEYKDIKDINKKIKLLEIEMKKAADMFDFETAINLKAEWLKLKDKVNNNNK
jgi:excinuclease ABC subunit B